MNKWIRRGNEVAEAIDAHCEATRPHYLRLLDSEHPELRIVGEMNARDSAPELVVRVLEELNHGKWGGTVRMNAYMTLADMRERGEIPAKRQLAAIDLLQTLAASRDIAQQ